MNKKQLKGKQSQDASLLSAHYQGPIPPPDFLRKYEEIVPGAANRILTMAESNNTHLIQHQAELLLAHKKESQYVFVSKLLGQFFGFVLFIIALIFCGFLVIHGKSLEAIGGFISIVSGFVVAYIYGHKK